MPEMQQTLEPTTSPAIAEEVAPLTSEPQAVINLAPNLPTLLLATQESELTELSESEGHLYDYRLVPQRQAAAVAEARVSVQTKKGVIKRAATPAKALHEQKVRCVRGNWTFEEVSGSFFLSSPHNGPLMLISLCVRKSLWFVSYSMVLASLNGMRRLPNWRSVCRLEGVWMRSKLGERKCRRRFPQSCLIFRVFP